MRTAAALPACIFCAVVLACSGSLPHPHYMGQPTTALTAVPMPPPPARVEVVPPRPAGGAVWVDGEWVFRRGRWAWSLGEWVAPAPGTFFSPWTAVRSADGTLLHAPGVWRNAKGEPIAPPPPLALATVQAGPVVDAEGVNEAIGRTVKPGSMAPSSSAPLPAPSPSSP